MSCRQRVLAGSRSRGNVLSSPPSQCRLAGQKRPAGGTLSHRRCPGLWVRDDAFLTSLLRHPPYLQPAKYQGEQVVGRRAFQPSGKSAIRPDLIFDKDSYWFGPFGGVLPSILFHMIGTTTGVTSAAIVTAKANKRHRLSMVISHLRQPYDNMWAHFLMISTNSGGMLCVAFE